MTHRVTVPDLDPRALSGSIADFARPPGADLLERTSAFFEWQSARRTSGLWPFSRSLESPPGAVARIKYEDGSPGEGLNFASQDYLSLAAHPAVRDAAVRAVGEFGVHSAGSPVLLGNTRLSLALERELAEALAMEHVVLFSTGWAAGFGSIVGLVRPNDHVVMDQLAHACLQQGAYACTRNVVRHAHLDADAVREALGGIRSQDTKNAILVVTEGLFSMDSDTPDIARVQETCREYGATLLVDVAHDLGALGPDGTGHIGLQRMLGKVDIVMGSFSKTFASNGGFLATHSRAVRQYVKAFGGSHTFSNALSPVQCAIVREALRIVRSEEGAERRARLLGAVNSLRDALAARGTPAMGAPSAIVPVPIGAESLARLASWLMFKAGVLANLVEYPAVGIGMARFRMQVMAAHTPAQAEQAAGLVDESVKAARAALAERA